MEAAAALRAGQAVLAGLRLGIESAQVWNEFNAELLRRQQAREADGKTLTMIEVHQLLLETHGKIAANHGKLVELATAQAHAQAQAAAK